MHTRPAHADDLPALTTLSSVWETRWFGEPETSADEVREAFGWVDSPEDDTLLVLDSVDRILAAAMRWRTDTALTVHPSADLDAVLDRVLPWFTSATPCHIDVTAADKGLRAALEARGWRHRKSSFDLHRDVTPDLDLPAPHWPDGVDVRGLGPDDAAAVHHLIYVDAAWAEVPGHPHRDLDEWRGIFVTDNEVPDQQVLAWRGDRLVGVAMGRTWDDGTGWVNQLATARDERGRGLGRAMLLEALRRRRAAGATGLGLSVQAENETALSLYRGIGLEIDREWQEFVPPERTD